MTAFWPVGSSGDRLPPPVQKTSSFICKPLSLYAPVMWQGTGRGMLNSNGFFCLQEAQVLSSDGKLLVECVYLVK